MKTLKEINFNDFVKLKRGYDLPNDKIVDGKYPVVASTSIKAFHKEYKVLPPSVVTGRSGSLGEVQFIDMPCWPLNTALYVKNFNKNNPKYVYYFLKMIHLENFNSGAGVPTLNQNHLHKLKIKVHSEKEQQQIAEILSAYDDLIETNNQRIATLEQLAQQIYKEWFVRMRFPGWETTPFHHGIPDAWEVKSIGEICSKVTDGSHFSPAFVPDGKPMASVKDMENYGVSLEGIKTISEQDFENLKKSDCLPKIGDVLIAKDGSYLKHVFVWNSDIEVVILSSIAILRPHLNESSYYLALTLKQDSTKSMMSCYVSGAALPRIILDAFKKMKILMPDPILLSTFDTIIQPIYEQIKVLIEQNEALTKTRNLLLPRLISGKLTIKQAEALAT